MGYGDVQALNPRSKITPHLNRLAKEGMTITDAHSPRSVYAYKVRSDYRPLLLAIFTQTRRARRLQCTIDRKGSADGGQHYAAGRLSHGGDR